jgi:hypothetical protein
MRESSGVVLAVLRELDEITVSDRVRQATDLRVQERLDRELVDRVAGYLDATPQELAVRVAELEEEWDIERVLILQSSGTALLGLGLGVFSGRRWLLLSAVTSGFLLQHALQGWCSPLTLHRRLGYRSRREIDLELYVLKALRGDYTALAGHTVVDAVM